MEKTNNPYLLVGLGNPSPTYFNTYHNLGFTFLDYCAKKNGIKLIPGKGRYYTGKKNQLLLLKPLTYMNLSGEALIDFFEREMVIQNENIIVVHDDLDMPKFSVKLKFDGSSGGHKGIESIIYHIKTENFWRLKLGISKPQNYSPKNYVLSRIPEEEMVRYFKLFEDMCAILQNIGIKDIKIIQQEINALRKKYVVFKKEE